MQGRFGFGKSKSLLLGVCMDNEAFLVCRPGVTERRYPCHLYLHLRSICRCLSQNAGACL